ncbi:MAG: winged helix-turn-helix domain-containing protein [Methylococcaceae bacterium]
MKKDEKAQIVNTKTGEIKEGYFIYIAHPKAKIRNERWIMTFQDSLIIIAKDKELTGEVKSVLFFLMGNLEFENYISIKQVEIAKQLELQKSNVSRAMKLLVDKSIILKIKDGSMTGYKLNPNYGWKGKVENREIAKNKMEENKIIDFQSALESRNDSGIKTEDVPY